MAEPSVNINGAPVYIMVDKEGGGRRIIFRNPDNHWIITSAIYLKEIMLGTRYSKKAYGGFHSSTNSGSNIDPIKWGAYTMELYR